MPHKIRFVGNHRIAQTLYIYHIRVSSRDLRGSSKNRQRHCSFNSFFKLTKTNTPKPLIAVTLCEESIGWFPLQRIVMRNRLSVISSSWQIVIDQSHKSLNAPVPYPQCTILKISVTKWCIVGYMSDALWDLWDGSIELCSGGSHIVSVTNICARKLSDTTRYMAIPLTRRKYLLFFIQNMSKVNNNHDY